mmetsp:Transcript_8736/g.27313  ORF Transcript_8736/g.27313 Transcript_8736/m.27313 type:complete len:282 (-) Transcript_8736:136-981(-)
MLPSSTKWRRRQARPSAALSKSQPPGVWGVSAGGGGGDGGSSKNGAGAAAKAGDRSGLGLLGSNRSRSSSSQASAGDGDRSGSAGNASVGDAGRSSEDDEPSPARKASVGESGSSASKDGDGARKGGGSSGTLASSGRSASAPSRSSRRSCSEGERSSDSRRAVAKTSSMFSCATWPGTASNDRTDDDANDEGDAPRAVLIAPSMIPTQASRSSEDSHLKVLSEPPCVAAARSISLFCEGVAPTKSSKGQVHVACASGLCESASSTKPVNFFSSSSKNRFL